MIYKNINIRSVTLINFNNNKMRLTEFGFPEGLKNRGSQRTSKNDKNL
jgi:hypothetical protein